jgi:hypothetical protein
MVPNRDGNSLEISTPREIKEWQFTIPQGSRKKKSIPRDPRGISRNGMLFHSTHFSGFTGIFGIIICIITENTNLCDTNSITIKKIPISFLSNFFCGIFPENVVLFGIFGIFEVLVKFWRGPEDPRSDIIYSLGNRGVKKGPGP